MNTKRLYVDFHVLQTVPPSCVNRDDTGSPKTAVYGGVTRARVSSQAWKHAMRKAFREKYLTADEVGWRTKYPLSLVAEQIKVEIKEKEEKDPKWEPPTEDLIMKLAEEALKKALKKPKKSGKKKKGKEKEGEEGEEGEEKDKKKGAEDESEVILFMSEAQARALAKVAIKEGGGSVEECKAALKNSPSVDMALFGRMIAKDASLNWDAAAQVAHSISTHAVQNEYDYFTALDDRKKDTEGAAYLDVVEYNSATLYRYATVCVPELMKSFKAENPKAENPKEKAKQTEMAIEETKRAIRAFAEAFVRSMPTGRQHPFANRTLPDAIYITLRTDQPVNLCGAFEKAIPAGAEGYVRPSAQALTRYAQKVYQNYAAAPAQAFAVGEGLELPVQPIPLNAALDALVEAVSQYLPGSEEG